jgi:hypothetical protein
MLLLPGQEAPKADVADSGVLVEFTQPTRICNLLQQQRVMVSVEIRVKLIRSYQ